jgi:transaldolase
METKTGMNTLQALCKAGQSPWYDNIDRRLIQDGTLKKLFDTGIAGVTSNPSIFEKAVRSSDVYDRQIRVFAETGMVASEICDGLTITDVGNAADLLRNTYKRSHHLDGYVSIEVPPDLAHDPCKTVETAIRIFNRIDRPNIMIKVPGTKEAPEAIRALIKEGINVNVTLLFSVGHYEAAARAYIEGLKERIRDGKDVKNVFSVASVFVSRVDTKIDTMLGEKKDESLKGRIAVANAKMIYQKFKELFHDGVFRDVKTKGGNIQRVLWASTSTKNPEYHDLKYVEELIAPETINTLPPETVEAFLDHGTIAMTAEKEIEREKAYLGKLKAFGIDIDVVCQEIQDAGVKAFQDSFNTLVNSIEQKM